MEDFQSQKTVVSVYALGGLEANFAMREGQVLGLTLIVERQ